MKYFLDTEFIEGTQKRPLILKGRLGNLMIGYPKPLTGISEDNLIKFRNNEQIRYRLSKSFKRYFRKRN
jgi:hypothetical protein